MTTRYTDAEIAAAKRLRFVNLADPPVNPMEDYARQYRGEAAYHRREAKKWDRDATAADLLARAIAREQRRAAREAS